MRRRSGATNANRLIENVPLDRQLLQPLTDRACIGRLGDQFEQARKIRSRRFDGTETGGEKPALAKSRNRVGRERDDAIEREERAREVAAGRIDPLEVDEHAHEHRSMRRRGEVLARHEPLIGRRTLEQLLQCGLIEAATPEERVDHNRPIAGTRVDSNEEMTGETHPASVHAGTPRDLAVDERERNRDAELTIEHVGKKTVLRIVIVLLVAPKPELLIDTP